MSCHKFEQAAACIVAAISCASRGNKMHSLYQVSENSYFRLRSRTIVSTDNFAATGIVIVRALAWHACRVWTCLIQYQMYCITTECRKIM